MGNLTEIEIAGKASKHARTALPYDAACARIRGGGKITLRTFKYVAYASSCFNAYHHSFPSI